MGLFRFLLFISLGLTACTQNRDMPLFTASGDENALYSLTGREHQVHFKALYRSTAKTPGDLDAKSLISQIKGTTEFLFGPLTKREIGGIQKSEKISPQLDGSYVEEGRVMVPYTYDATWLIHNQVLAQNSLRLPVPFSVLGLRTAQWQKCTDSGEDHNTWSFFWYFWDPERPGCDHLLNVQYQEVEVAIGKATTQTKVSFPEYARMVHDKEGVPTMSMTFAFGYVEDNAAPNPFRDRDFGMEEFRRFYNQTKMQLLALNFNENPILQRDITQGSTIIGSKFVGDKEGVRVEVSILAAAGVDQMDLFAYSYGQNHDGFFGWFGHSRVGSGFDADQFAYRLASDSHKFSLTSDYQLVYWAGCNSYSYYTLPFFRLKSKLNPALDPDGTKNLDLISNALPSLFALNAENAKVLFQALIHWDTPTSYQSIVQEIERTATLWRTEVIVNVLGDEDNPR